MEVGSYEAVFSSPKSPEICVFTEKPTHCHKLSFVVIVINIQFYSMQSQNLCIFLQFSIKKGIITLKNLYRFYILLPEIIRFSLQGQNSFS